MHKGINQLLPRLKIHSWGGFGSQLFTCYLILMLKERYPGRRIKVIIHTSGVTRRTLEINFTSQNVKFAVAEDYRNSNSQMAKIASKKVSVLLISALKSFIRRMVEEAKFVLNSNNDKSFTAIKPWTLSLRGHYTNLTLKPNLVQQLYNLLFQSNLLEQFPSTVIHYRLGDLIYLESKSPVTPQRIVKLIEELFITPERALLLTDASPEEYYSFVEESEFLKDFKPVNQSPLETLKFCVRSEILIGTSAKIAIWAAIFRQFIFQRNTYLPKELRWSKTNGLDSIWY